MGIKLSGRRNAAFTSGYAPDVLSPAQCLQRIRAQKVTFCAMSGKSIPDSVQTEDIELVEDRILEGSQWVLIPNLRITEELAKLWVPSPKE